MRKSTLFISAALTAFMLAVLFGVVSAYQDIVSATQQVTDPTPSVAAVQAAAPTQAPTQVPLPTQPANITPEQAAAIASSVIGRTDLYSVELTQLDGVDVYLVTFSSGDLVYVSLQGQVVSISKLPITVVTKPKGDDDDDKKSKNNDDEHEDDDD